MILMICSVNGVTAFPFLDNENEKEIDVEQELEIIVDNVNEIKDWKHYEDFKGNIQIYISGDKYYINVINHNLTLHEGVADDYDYVIKPNKNDLKTIKQLTQNYSEDGELSFYDNLQLTKLYMKIPIIKNHNNEDVNVNLIAKCQSVV